jgi:FkbM family methyltransferase
MNEFIDIINSHGLKNIKTIMEIGSLHGDDANILEQNYKTNNVFIIEAHPIFAKTIQKKYPNTKVFNIAATNINENVTFNSVNPNDPKLGISSLHNRRGANYYPITIQGSRMDSFIQDNNIDSIDILKIDVEGHSLNVLEGFGNKLKIIKSLHIECEHIIVWEKQSLYCDIEKFLFSNNFILSSIKYGHPQSDSVWLRKDLYNNNWWK